MLEIIQGIAAIKGLFNTKEYDPFGAHFSRQIALAEACLDDIKLLISAQSTSPENKDVVPAAILRLQWSAYLFSKHVHTTPLGKLLEKMDTDARKKYADEDKILNETRLQTETFISVTRLISESGVSANSKSYSAND